MSDPSNEKSLKGYSVQGLDELLGGNNFRSQESQSGKANNKESPSILNTQNNDILGISDEDSSRMLKGGRGRGKGGGSGVVFSDVRFRGACRTPVAGQAGEEAEQETCLSVLSEALIGVGSVLAFVFVAACAYKALKTKRSNRPEPQEDGMELEGIEVESYQSTTDDPDTIAAQQASDGHSNKQNSPIRTSIGTFTDKAVVARGGRTSPGLPGLPGL